jgi:hypothetical protein
VPAVVVSSAAIDAAPRRCMVECCGALRRLDADA